MDIESRNFSLSGTVGGGKYGGEEVSQMIMSGLDLTTSVACEEVVTKRVISVPADTGG